jgi:hypothetical protein
MMDGNTPPSDSSRTGVPGNGAPDDDTVATPPRGDRAKSNERSLVEKTIKFRFAPMATGDAVHPHTLHIHWMQAIQQAFGDQVQFFDNANRRVPVIDPIRTEASKSKLRFTLHGSTHSKRKTPPLPLAVGDRRSTKYILHRVRTAYSISDLKADPKVMTMLKEHNFYVNEHRWSEEDWDVLQIGFMFGIDPTFYDVDQATAKITADIAKSTSTSTKAPKFKLVYSTPKVTSGKKVTRTKAYAIETHRSSAVEMAKLLKEVYRNTGEFVPFEMRRRKPDDFKKILQAQTKMIASHRVVVLNYIGEDAMYYLEDHIQAITRVKMMFPARSIEVDGSYRLLVNSSEFENARKYLLKYLTPLYEQYVEPDTRPNPQRYAGPPQVSPLDSDDYSQGEQSYMTISVNTALSYASALSDEENSLPDDVTATNSGSTPPIPKTVPKPSWAEAASRRSSAATSSGSGAQSQANRSKEDDLVSDLASSRAEVEELRAQVVQLHEDKRRTDALIADTVKEQVAQALQAHLSTISEERISQSQFATFMESQNRRFDDLVTIFRQHQTFSENNISTTAKRGVPEEDGDTHMEDSPSRGNALDDNPNRTTKRVDDRGTPHRSAGVSNVMQDLQGSEPGHSPINLLPEFKTPERKNRQDLSDSVRVDSQTSSTRSGSKNQSGTAIGAPAHESLE